MKKTLISALAAITLLTAASPAFAACEVFYGPRDIDRPVASTSNAERGMVLNGADYTDWETIAYTTPLSVTTGGFEIVATGVFDVTDPTKPQRIHTIAISGGQVINTQNNEICAS